MIRIVARIVEAGLITLNLLFPFREIHLNRKRARPSARFLHRRSTRVSSNSPNANHPQERPFRHSIHERTNRKLKLTRIWAADPFLLIHLISVFASDRKRDCSPCWFSNTKSRKIRRTWNEQRFFQSDRARGNQLDQEPTAEASRIHPDAPVSERISPPHKS